MSAVAHLVISRDDLIPDFGVATVDRGAQYARQGRISELSWEPDGYGVTGVCSGSHGYVYEVQVGFADLDNAVIGWTECDCPVGDFCKHAVALLLTAAAQRPEPPRPDQWRSVLARVLDELTAASDGTDTGALIGLQFALTVPSLYVPEQMVSIRPMTVGKRGTWIKSGLSWQQVLYGNRTGEFDHEQFSAVRELAGAFGRPGMSVAGQELLIGTASEALWPRLWAAQDAGVTLIADKSSGLRAVELIKNAQLRPEFSGDGSGGALLSVKLLIDGAEADPTAVRLIGRPKPHGMHQNIDGVLRLGAFDPAPGPAMLELATAGTSVRIPAENVDEVALNVLPQLAGRAMSLEIEEGLFTLPEVTGPLAVLTVTPTGDGVRAYWSTRYEINGRHHDFDPDSPAEPTRYRDAAVEDRLWQRAAPLLRSVAATAQQWKTRAVQRVHSNMVRSRDGALAEELNVLRDAADSGSAVAVASLSTLRGAVDLTGPEMAVLCAEILPAAHDLDDVVIVLDESVPDFRAAQTPPRLMFGANDAPASKPGRPDWFDLDITVDVDGHRVPLPDVLADLSGGATHMVLSNGVYFRLDTPELVRLRELLDEARALGEIEGDRVNARSLNVTLWEELLQLGVVDKQLATWRKTLTRLANARPPRTVGVPRTLKATLRDYQRDGLAWLSFLWDNGLGGILADDMGLGKTVQTLALIARAAAGGAGKFLVVAPTSVVGNWVAEANRFTPTLTAVAVEGTEARTVGNLAELAADADIVVTSYTLLRIDFDAYSRLDWSGVILDEAQFVKNHNSKTHQCVRRLDCPFKLAITGTPMENNLMELWALLSITAPGLFPSPTTFGTYFRKPIESGTNRDRLPVLRRRIKPMMLRRTKTQVITELPSKQEQLLSLDLGTRHRKIYDTRLSRERQKVLGLLGDWEKNRFRIFRSLTLLRQLSLHAGLIDAGDADVGSVKVDFLVEQLPQLVADGHSALVFSQFTGFLSILRQRLDAAKVSYSYLDGSVSARRRKEELARFAAGENKTFLISLKAGGFGLNLTQADYCFLCDPWWSPAAEAQAVDRTHRIGQTRPVSVYRLVSAATIEEKVVGLQQRKKELFTAVLDDGELFSTALTASDVRELLA